MVGLGLAMGMVSLANATAKGQVGHRIARSDEEWCTVSARLRGSPLGQEDARKQFSTNGPTTGYTPGHPTPWGDMGRSTRLCATPKRTAQQVECRKGPTIGW